MAISVFSKSVMLLAGIQAKLGLALDLNPALEAIE
jgi:hypothetical protein